MCIEFDGHHSGGSSFAYVYNILNYYKCGPYPQVQFGLKKIQVKSPSIWSRVSETGSDPPIGSDRETGCDKGCACLTLFSPTATRLDEGIYR